MPRLPPCCCFNCQAVVDWCLHLRSWALGLGTSRGVWELHARYQKLGRSFWGISKATRTFLLPNPEVQCQDQRYQVQGSVGFAWLQKLSDSSTPMDSAGRSTDWVGRAHVPSACVVCWFLVLLPYLGACSSLRPLLTAVALMPFSCFY